ncbi:alternative ribosome rescue aminoacyl-tRNA hydrolase ArfB [Cytophaga hutchinsonii]|nr:alternative ribosome rescue aminoacyl-tRNA hydrolase ArfB [Cytophaga hutchinsonii]SFX50423.1 ribosome-associated protein [Cytophaga hutchinsonii ATCC 33406]
MMFPPRYSNPDYWKESGIIQEARFQTSLSGGKGGQNVNKVSTKVEIYWSPSTSAVLSEDARARVLEKISSKIDNDGEIRVTCDTSRSQLQNKKTAIDKLSILLAFCFKENKPRKASKPTHASVKKRLESKKIQKDIKANRRKGNYE